MTITTELQAAPPMSLPAVAQDAMRVLYQHRMMSTPQLHRLLTPNTARPVYLLKQLNRLRELGVADRVRVQGPELTRMPYMWFLTDVGADQVELDHELMHRPYRVTEGGAMGTRQAHTLAVNDVGLAFVEHARRLAHECGPLDWTPEVAGRIRDGQRRFEDDHVISDAVVNYVHIHPNGRRTPLQAFIELDRATMTVTRLAAKLAAYGRMYDYIPQEPDRPRAQPGARPAWRYQYPTFPQILVVLTGASPRALAGRARDLALLAGSNPRLMRHRETLAIGVTTLAHLQKRGPLEPIFTPLLRDFGPTDLYLRPPADEDDHGVDE
ncbi:replication-relaxation family protein [Kitasatospora sp. MBT63]|uniref:replication-relaxation family protein n=1 Tax=Kitasatospora sp. MBT63 TaxID=1444768 RepID=UPI000A736F67|nr:replication-relaxation family protein [Kitasatospora sp. MBT63]